MNRTRDEFLTCPRLAEDEHVGVGGRHCLDLLEDITQGSAFANHPLKVRLSANFLLDVDAFLSNSVLKSSEVIVDQPVVDCQGQLARDLAQERYVLSGEAIGLQARKPDCSKAAIRRAQWQSAEGSISQLEVLQPLTCASATLISATVRDPQRLLMLIDAPQYRFLQWNIFPGGLLGCR